MNSIFKILSHRYAYHVYFWGLLGVVFVFWGSDKQGLGYGVRMSLAFIIPWILATYTHFYIHTLFFKKRKYLIYFALIIPVIAAFGYLSEVSVNNILYENVFERSGYIDVTLILTITTGLRYFRRGINQQYILQEMEAKQLNAELNLLKSQVNPHFLFNTLNNLFSIAQKNEDHTTADGLMKLSQLMRYMIYDSNVELVSLEKEITYIRNFIELQRLRFDNQDLLKVDFQITDNFKSTFICPIILIPFIENAFKHGLSTEEHNKIDIAIGIENKILNLKVKNTINTIKTGTNGKNSGIGLDNVKRRLKIIYPDRHDLTISSDSEYFYVDLKIEL